MRRSSKASIICSDRDLGTNPFQFFELEGIEQVGSQIGETLKPFQFDSFLLRDRAFDLTADQATAAAIGFRPVVGHGDEIPKNQLRELATGMLRKRRTLRVFFGRADGPDVRRKRVSQRRFFRQLSRERWLDEMFLQNVERQQLCRCSFLRRFFGNGPF